MIEAFQYINKAFESKVRLGIMAILMVSEAAEKFLPCLLGFVIGQDASSDRSSYQYERGYYSHQFKGNN